MFYYLIEKKNKLEFQKIKTLQIEAKVKTFLSIL